MKSPRPWLVAAALTSVALMVWFRSEPDRVLVRAWGMQGSRGLDAVAFTPDSRHLLGLVKEQDLLAEVWDADSGRSHPERFSDILVGPLLDPIARPQAVFSGSSGIWCLSERNLVVRKIPTGEEQQRLTLAGDVQCVQPSGEYRIGPCPAFAASILTSRDGRWLATGFGPVTGHAAEGIVLVDTATGQERMRFGWGPCAFSDDGRWLVVAQSDGERTRLRLWDLQGGASANESHIPASAGIRTVQFLSDNHLILSRGPLPDEAPDAGYIEVRTVPELRQASRLPLPEVPTQLDVSRNGHTVVTRSWISSGQVTELLTWDASTLKHLASPPEAVSLTAGAELIAGSRLGRPNQPRTNTLNVLRLPSLELVRSFAPVLSGGSRLPFLTPDGRLLLVLEQATEWSHWNGADVAHRCLSVYRVGNGECAARMRRWDTTSYGSDATRIVRSGGTLPAIRTLLLSHDGRRMATVSRSGELSVWKLPE